MTGGGWCCLAHHLILVSRAGSPSPLIPLPSRERGLRMVYLVFCPSPAPPLWIADQVRNDVTMRCIVYGFPPTRNELAPRSQPAAAGVAGSYLTASYSAWRVPALWIPAYAGMTVQGLGWCCYLCLVMAKSWFCSPFR